MNTEFMDMTKGPEASALARAGRIIREGGLVAFPTETVYGLGGDALQKEASERIYAAKGRPSDNPLIVHIARRDDLSVIAAHIPKAASVLADKFWPGPLTMILRKKNLVPPETTGGLDTVAVRMPDHPVALELIRRSGGFIAAPSANTSGRPSPTRAAHVLEDLDGKIDAVIDGGDVPIGIESTIVDLTGPAPVLLRPGFISTDMLAGALGTAVETDPGIGGLPSEARPKAPGMKYRHYAPRAAMCIVEGGREAVIGHIRHLVSQDEAAGRRAGIITCSEDAGRYDGGEVRDLGSRQAEQEIASRLFAVLREFDTLQVDVIYSEAFHTPQLGQAIMNRLMKAAGGKKVTL